MEFFFSQAFVAAAADTSVALGVVVAGCVCVCAFSFQFAYTQIDLEFSSFVIIANGTASSAYHTIYPLSVFV